MTAPMVGWILSAIFIGVLVFVIGGLISDLRKIDRDRELRNKKWKEECEKDEKLYADLLTHMSENIRDSERRTFVDRAAVVFAARLKKDGVDNADQLAYRWAEDLLEERDRRTPNDPKRSRHP